MSCTPRILLVVDEAAEAEGLASLFTQAAPDRPFQTVSNEKDALEALQSNDFEIVFADLKAGALNGTQFLHEVWKVRPKAVRFLLETTIDSDVLVTCVLGAHHFLPKPLDLTALKAALQRADSMNRLLRNERIQSLVSRMRTLPSRPSLYLELMRELRSANASANVVGELVAKDLAISARLIQVVNSAYYGLQQHVSDPASAVLLLGLETTASLVLSIEAFARFDKVKPLYFSMDRVWKHCQSVAHSAKQIAELLNNDPEVARNAFTAGLLHDIGKLALALNFEEQYHGALKLAEKQKLSPCEVESQVFGANHAEAGAYLLSQWGLPLPIVEAVADHHLPARDLAKEFSAATALHLAERLEYAEDLARNGVKDVQVDLDYPAELELAPRMEELRRIVRREEALGGPSEPAKTADSEGTMIFTRSQLKASPAPVPASGEPAPLVNVLLAERKAPSPKKVFGIIGVVSILVAVAVACGFGVRRKKSDQVSAAQHSEWRNHESRGPLSNLLVGSSEKMRHPPSSPRGSRPPEDPFAELKLQGIMFNGAKSSCFINGHAYHLGDEIDGARIVSFRQDAVVIEKAGAQHELTLSLR